MTSDYISPLTDYGFKRLFAEEQSKDLLIDFLNEILGVKIISIRFCNTQKLSDISISRGPVYDFFCIDDKKRRFIVAMQNASQTYFKDRTLFYATFPIWEQAQKGDWDFRLKPVYCIGILNFAMGKNLPAPNEDIHDTSEYMHTVQLKNQNNIVFYEKLTFIYIELVNFTKSESNLSSRLEKWLYFLKNLPEFRSIPEILISDSIFTSAFNTVDIARFSHEEAALYERSLKEMRDNINIIDTAWREGIEEGRMKGREEGRMKGREKERHHLAKNLCSLGMDDEFIIKATGLNKEIIIRLRTEPISE